jgi:hypothetical protein
MKLKDALNQGKIEKIRSFYLCSECNLQHDTPFEAINCFKGHTKSLTKEEEYFNNLGASLRRNLRIEYSNNDLFWNKYETVAHYAYHKEGLSC